MNSLRLHISVRIHLLLLATLLSKPTRNSRRVSPYQVSRVQLNTLITPWSSGVWRSTRLNAQKNRSSKRVPAGVQSGSGLLQNAFHKISSVCSWSGNLNVFSRVSTAVISTDSSHLDVATDHETLQPQRWGCDMSGTSSTSLCVAMARPAVASTLISRLGLSPPSPNPFALTLTPCCSRITPRSRIIETQQIPTAAALTAA